MKAKGIPPKVRAEVYSRSGGWCEIRAKDCRGNVAHLHHRLMRSQGGKHTADNLAATCHSCHVFIHANPAISYQRGWLRRGVT